MNQTFICQGLQHHLYAFFNARTRRINSQIWINRDFVWRIDSRKVWDQTRTSFRIQTFDISSLHHFQRSVNKYLKEIKLKIERGAPDKKVKAKILQDLDVFYQNVRYKGIQISIDVDPM